MKYIPSEELPVLSTTVTPNNKSRKPPKVRPPPSHHGQFSRKECDRVH